LKKRASVAKVREAALELQIHELLESDVDEEGDDEILIHLQNSNLEDNDGSEEGEGKGCRRSSLPKGTLRSIGIGNLADGQSACQRMR
jgi:hypothetical protein